MRTNALASGVLAVALYGWFVGAGGAGAPDAAETNTSGVKETGAAAPEVTPPPIKEPEMVAIEGGCFEMGSPVTEAGRFENEPQHPVCVKPFKIGKFEITEQQWREAMEVASGGATNCDRCPVQQVSWGDVNDYIARLNARTGKNYRLPTEAEWEYACRGGVAGETYCGGNEPDALAWFAPNSESRTHEVGQKQANRLGLYDMSGNVWEWTCSAYADDYRGAETTCVALDSRGNLAVRGGARFSEARYIRAAVRDDVMPDDRGGGVGLRLAAD